MSSIYTGLITPGSDYMTVLNRVYPVLNETITIPSNISGSATVIVTSSYADGGYFYNSAHNITCKSTLYFCDSAGNNAVAIMSKELAVGGSDVNSVYKQTVNLSALKGKRIYAKMVPVTASGTAGVVINTRHDYDGLKIEILFNAVAGEKILAIDRSQTGTTTTAGTVMKDSHFTSGTKITASAFNSNVLGG